MDNTDRHPECHMRTALGNCDPIGGFCTSVNEPICEALHKVSRPQGERIAKDGVFYCSCCDNDSAGLSDDAISKKWVLNEIITKIENDDSLTDEQKDSLSAVKYLIRHAPPVSSRPQREWMDSDGDTYCCSNCGTDMRGEK